jgi:hypothetical protein
VRWGYFELKNVKLPVRIYAVSNEGLVVPSRDELKEKQNHLQIVCRFTICKS